MRGSRLAAALAVALVVAAPAGAHVIPSPTFLPAGETTTVELTVPNERDAPMTGFVVTVPAGLEVLAAEETPGWTASVEGRSATWAGGTVPALLSDTFGLRVQAGTEPGTLELEAEQRYQDGGTVRWPVSLTIVPGASSSTVTASSSGSGTLLAALAGVGLLVAGGVVLLAVLARRRGAA